MSTITYEDLIKPLDRDAVISTALGIFAVAEFPTTAWGETDEPRAIIEFEADTLVDLSNTIVAIGKMGITQDAEGDALTLHASDVFGLDRKPGLPSIGTVTLADSSGSPQVFAAGDLVFTSKSDPSLVFKADAVTVPGLGTADVSITSEEIGKKYLVQASDLQLSTPSPGLTFTAASGLTWLTQSGADTESDAELRRRCFTRWATLSTTGSADAYVNWALTSTSEINRARVQENPDALVPDPMVTVWVAGPAGPATSAAVTAASFAIQSKRPLGTRVTVANSAPYTVTIGGSYSVKTASAASAAAYIERQFLDWFSGADIVVGPKTMTGLGIGDGVFVAQIYEIIMSAPGVTDCALTDATGALLPNATWGAFMPPGTPSADAVATRVMALTQTLI